MPRFFASSLLVFALALTARAADWPQFLGPTRDNTTPDVVKPWKGDLKVLWKAAVGDAHSSPVVAGGIVYAFHQPKGKNADALAAFDATTGKQLWEKSYERAEYKPPFGNGPRSTPAISNGKVYTYGGLGFLTCWDAKTGEIDWKVDAFKDFKAPTPFFGNSTSPIVVGGNVVVMVGGKGAGVVAFDAKTGKPAWQATDDPNSYSSPTFTGKQFVFLTGANLLGLSEKGEKLWSVPFEGKVGPIIESSATPIRASDLVIGSTVSSGSIGLKLNETSDGKVTVEKVWANKGLPCYFSTPVVRGKHIFMVNGEAKLKGAKITLRCVEMETGKIAWSQPTAGEYHAALLLCGKGDTERFLMLDDSGGLTLFEPNRGEYVPLASSKVCGKTWAHPALADGKLYLRDEKELICVELPK